jgi:glycosidase
MGTTQLETQNSAIRYSLREADWRNGAIVYQVLVDRFNEPENPAAKRKQYAFPRRYKSWTEVPERGEFLADFNVWSHEVDFWGGDLRSVQAKLSYLTDLDVDVLYLNPIHAAFTNHKYDAYDYFEISPEYGTWDDLRDLIDTVHQRKMKIVLDGVFNHMGRNSRLFTQAASDPENPYRGWFYFDGKCPTGVRVWANAPSLPELNYENPAVTDYIYGGSDSVVKSYLRRGIDGWRLDTAFELGYHYLAELTTAAHQEKPGSLVVGEIWNYPQDWFPALDAVMNFTLRGIILDCLHGHIGAGLANEMIAKVIADAGIEEMLKSWLLLDNHDTPRINVLLPDPRDQRLAQVLQFTLPGSPNLYYGSELGMQGGDDPENRAPMRWDLAGEGNEVLRWFKTLIKIRKSQRALKVGDYRKILTGQLVAFERCTERVDETVIVIVNPTGENIQENVLVPDSKLMNGTVLVDLLHPTRLYRLYSGLVRIEIPPKSAAILKPRTASVGGYTPYKRTE